MKNALKAISKTDDELIVQNYMVLFGGRDMTGVAVHGYETGKKNADGSTGEFFTKATAFDSDLTRLNLLPVSWEHHKEPTESTDIAIGKVDWKSIVIDDIGLLVNRILNRRSKFVQAVEPLIEAGLIGSSSEAFPMAKKATGEITEWPVLGDTLTVQPFDVRMLDDNPVLMKAVKQLAEIDKNLKALIPEAARKTVTDDATVTTTVPDIDFEFETKEVDDMPTKEELLAEAKAVAKAEAEYKANKRILDLWEAKDKEKEAEKAAAAKQQADNDAAVAARVAEEVAKLKPDNDGAFGAPYVAKHAEAWQYDNYEAADLATALEVVNEAHKGGKNRNEHMVKALALRLESDEAKDETERTGPGGMSIKTAGPQKVASSFMKAANVKANETNFSTNAGYGDEWIGVSYSGQLWEQVRTAAEVANRIPSFEFPAGAESMVIPLESTDPIWYLVAQAGDPSDNVTRITLTVPTKALATAQTTMTLGKLGSATYYTGEMTEDSVLPFAAQLRTQIGKSGGEILDHVVIDGDTETGATTNINDIASTPDGGEAFLIFNGFRKSCLVTTTANSVSGGTLTTDDFLETVKLMGPAGKVSYDTRMTSFIIDPNTHWKSLPLADVKTKDIFANPTIENGRLTGIYGYEVITSYFMHFASLVNTTYEYRTEATGKIDLNTAADNTKGAILAVRWDYWKLGFRRRVTTEVERIPRADSWEITSLMRLGLTQRDTEASAISYNLTV